MAWPGSGAWVLPRLGLGRADPIRVFDPVRSISKSDHYRGSGATIKCFILFQLVCPKINLGRSKIHGLAFRNIMRCPIQDPAQTLTLIAFSGTVATVTSVLTKTYDVGKI